MKKRSNVSIMRQLIKLTKSLSIYLLLAIFMGVLGHLCAAGITILGGYAVLQLLQIEIPFGLTSIFVCLGIFALMRGGLRYAEQLCNHFIAFKLLALIRSSVFGALRKLSPAKLEGRDRGDLISIITSDIELLEVFYAHTISPAAIALLFSLILTLLIGHYHWLLGLLAATAFLVIGLVVPIVTSYLSRHDGRIYRSKSGALSSFVLDSLRGLPEILQYAMGSKRLAEMGRITDEMIECEERMKKNTAWNMAMTNTIVLVFDLAMLLVAAWLYQNGTINFAGVLIPVIALMSSFGPVIALANLGSTLQSTLAAGERVLDILDEVPVVNEIYNCPQIEFTGVTVDRINFGYGEETILQDVSLTIPEHSVVGIVGSSGSGKSTLLKLLMRFWDVQQGDIFLSDTPIDQVNTQNLRSMESYLTQETHLFHDSIINNLRIAKLDATQQEIDHACKQASIYDFIKNLPDGYHTLVKELGDSLSGGERQRLGLARAFLHNAKFMLLDEPTSNLDSLNEAIILKALHESAKEKTVILVSHRRSTLQIADSIYTMSQGKMR